MITVEGWTTGQLGQLCSIEIGGTPSRSNPDFWDSSKETSNRWVSIRDLNRSVIIDTTEYISDSGVKYSNVKLQNPGTVLLSFKLSIGRVAFAGVPLYTNEAIAGLNSDKIDQTYLFHGLHQWDLLQGVDQAIKGATLNKEKLKKITFEYPQSLSEQTKIAEVLSTVDRAIEQTEALIAKQQRIKTGLMQDLLTRGIDEHGDLRSEQTHKFKDSPLGRIPVEWGIYKIGHLIFSHHSGVYKKRELYGEGSNIVGVSDLYRNLSISGQIFRRVPLTKSEQKFYSLKAGDLIYGESSLVLDGIAKTLWTTDDGEGTAFAWHTRRLCIRNEIVDSQYLYFVLAASIVRKKIMSVATQTALTGITTTDLFEIPVFVPSKSEQKAVAKRLDHIDRAIAQEDKTLQKLSRMKTALMQDLLTGKKRVTAMLEKTP